MQQKKIVIVGDRGVGKTCLVMTGTGDGVYPHLYIPTLHPESGISLMIDKIRMVVDIHDTTSQLDFDNLRPLCYPHTDVFLVCFAVDSPTSFRNVHEKWVPEIRHHCPDVPFLLVGTKCDMRVHHNPNVKSILRLDCVQLGKRVGAARYVECSAFYGLGVRDVFNEALIVSLFHSRDLIQMSPSQSQTSRRPPHGLQVSLSRVMKYLHPRLAIPTKVSGPSCTAQRKARLSDIMGVYCIYQRVAALLHFQDMVNLMMASKALQRNILLAAGSYKDVRMRSPLHKTRKCRYCGRIICYKCHEVNFIVYGKPMKTGSKLLLACAACSRNENRFCFYTCRCEFHRTG